MYALHDIPKALALTDVEPLVYCNQSLNCRRLEPYENTHAPSFLRQLQQLVIIAEVDRSLTDPGFGQALADHRPEEFLGVGNMIPAGADQVVVHEQNYLLFDLPQFFDHILHGPVAKLSAIEGCDTAEATIQWAPPRGLDRAEVVSASEQLMSGGGNILDLDQAALVDALKLASLDIL
jgi:hypothetical protein